VTRANHRALLLDGNRFNRLPLTGAKICMIAKHDLENLHALLFQLQATLQ